MSAPGPVSGDTRDDMTPEDWQRAGKTTSDLWQRAQRATDAVGNTREEALRRGNAVTTSDPARVRRGRNSKARGKVVEREVARLLGATRNRDGGPKGTPDIETEDFIVEVKSHRTGTPRWIADAWAQVMTAPDETDRRRITIHTFIDAGKRTIWQIERLK